MGAHVVTPVDRRLRRAVGLALASALALASCATEEGAFVVEPGMAEPADTVDDAAWRHLGMVEDVLPDRAAAALVEDTDELATVWQRFGFEGEVPDVDLADRVVLLLGQADDACPDELVGLEVVDGQLQLGWLPPPGGCIQPLVLRLHAVEVHRGHLPSRFTVALDPPYDDELAPVTLELAPYDGVAPTPPAPPEAMSDAEVDEVFAGHPVRRCDPASDRWWQGESDGLADDDEELRASDLMDQLLAFLRAEGWDLDREVTPLLARDDGVQPTVLAGVEDADRLRQLLDARFGAGAIEVVVSPWEPAAIADAQVALTGLLSDQGAGWSVAWISGPPGPAEVGLVDPTREALDTIAALVDPELVCVEVLRSGIAQLQAPVGRG